MTGSLLKILGTTFLILGFAPRTVMLSQATQARLEEALEVKDEPETRLRLAEVLARSGEPSKAADHFQILILNSSVYRSNLIKLAREIFYLGMEPDALGLLEQYLLRNPGDIDVRTFFGDLLGFYERHNAALLQYEKVLETEPDHLEAQVSKAKVLSWKGNLETSLELFKRALDKQPDHERALVGYGFALSWAGNKVKAREVFQRARELNPADPELEQALLSLQSEEITGELGDETVSSSDESARTRLEQISFLLTAAQHAANRGDLDEACNLYRQTLEINAKNVTARRQLARVLSWSRKFEEAVAVYDEILTETPGNLQARLELARVKSWDTRYRESLQDYRGLLETLGGSERGGVNPSEVRLEMARVLSWDGQFDEALAEIKVSLDSTLEDGSEKIDLMVERARILGYMRRYQDALDQYDEILALDSENLQARLGKAQVLYWSGQYAAARVELEEVLASNPNDETANLVLANVEYSLGRKARALVLLEGISENPQAASLMESIRGQMRPVLRFSTGFEDSRETPNTGLASTLKSLRYTSSLSFSPNPDYRFEVLNVTSQNNTSNWVLSRHGRSSLSSEMLFRVNYRPTPALNLLFGGGAGFTGNGEICPLASLDPCVSQAHRSKLLYEIRPNYEVGNFALVGSASRRLANYTPLATHNNIVDRREGAGISYTWRRRIRIGADYWHSTLGIEEPEGTELKTSAQGGSLDLGYLVDWEKVRLDLTFRYDVFGYSDSAAEVLDPNRPSSEGSPGVFMPRLYARFAPGARLAWTPTTDWLLRARGSLGPQRLLTFEFPPTVIAPPSEYGLGLSAGGGPTFKKKNWEVFVSYDYYRSTTPSFPGAIGDGSYQTHVFLGGFLRKF